MSPAQRILRAVLPARWFVDLEAATRRWEVACATCGRAADLWEAGGLRWKGGTEDRTKGFCTACNARRTMIVRQKAARAD